uniref:Cytochrome c oxidase subunit 3 n=2 Tax=cellular organisms TaxID=131567 RepID=M9MU60_FLAVE|nr:cytochrome c oxidase subunit 3 [Flammulina velutipes]AEF33902.1 cytochrome c oxidase subunit 3 [Flammulina velutipes]AEO19631.1 cytochrome c oxidase subunit 3 [Flammulina velutipes]AEO19663.1 cytochrome c oxidase subunit 3 [Flammulina velutipes]AEO19694.1 cytochrome c oxidase subunit 3 [Flammulina velutipes]
MITLINFNFSNVIKKTITGLKNMFQAHPYHLVDNSPWPFSISWTLFYMAIGAVLSMQGFVMGSKLLLLGLLTTCGVMFFWFRDVNTEGTLLGNHTKEVKKGLVLGFLLFVISEVMAFLSVFWAYFHSALSPSVELGGNWPPLGITPLDSFSIPLLNTFLLLSSGAFITYGHHTLIGGKRFDAITSIFITIILALIFTMFQYFEYVHADFSIADGVFGTVFYASTGLHGFHVIIGTIFIIVMFGRQILFYINKQGHVGLESSILYWHFVDIVWLFLYMTVYVWGSNSSS